MKQWPTYEIKELNLKWRFFSFFAGSDWAIGIIRLDKIKPKPDQAEGGEGW